MTSSKRFCYFHYNCFDGMGAAWSVWKHAPTFEFCAIDYEDDAAEPPHNVEDAVVMVVDFSFAPAIMDRMLQQVRALTLLDHHPRAKDYIRDLVRERRYEQWGFELAHYRYDADWIQVILATRDMAGVRNRIHLEYDKHRSGAQMTWEHMAGTNFKTPAIIRHMSDYDRWKFELPRTMDVITGLGQYPIELDTYISFMDEPGLVDRLIADAPEQERLRELEIKNAIHDTLRMCTVAGHEVPLIECRKLITSRALNELSQHYPFAMSFYETNTHRKFSLRSRKEGGVNVREIAMMLGGGGHDHAAGINVPYENPSPLQKVLLRL